MCDAFSPCFAVENHTINIPSTVYVCRQNVASAVLTYTTSTFCYAHMRIKVKIDLEHWHNSQLSCKYSMNSVFVWINKETNKQRHSMKSKRPCLQDWPNLSLLSVYCLFVCLFGISSLAWGLSTWDFPPIWTKLHMEGRTDGWTDRRTGRWMLSSELSPCFAVDNQLSENKSVISDTDVCACVWKWNCFGIQDKRSINKTDPTQIIAAYSQTTSLNSWFTNHVALFTKLDI